VSRLVACIPFAVKAKALKVVDFPAEFLYGLSRNSQLGEFERTEIRAGEDPLNLIRFAPAEESGNRSHEYETSGKP
jgi:hypothetical protein